MTARAILQREGHNVTQTDATRKNARQNHPPRTVPPSQLKQNAPLAPSRYRSTLPIAAARTIFALLRQNHPPNTGKTPQLRPQFRSREGDSVAGGRNRTGRAKRSPKTGATGERTGCTDKKGGGKFDPSGCGGHKNSENAATFSEFLGQEDKLSPALPGIERGARPVKDTTGTNSKSLPTNRIRPQSN